jgi:hypothetical protein
MNTKKILVLSLAAAFAVVMAGMLIASRKTENPVALELIIQPPANPISVISESKTPPAEIPTVESKPPIQPAQAGVQPTVKPLKIAVQTASPAKGKEPVQDPAARVALSFVGVDPDAEAYWMSAISDPKLPDQEREDLMEDLNEDGLSDPKHPGPEDLPLILNRLAIIEEIAPYADPFMQEHLGEAYKDLNNMLDGKPVQ